jgi:hypothetical protein
MLDQLISSLKSEAGERIGSQTSLPDGSLDKVFSVIGDVTKKEVTGQMLGGVAKGILGGLFKKDS